MEENVFDIFFSILLVNAISIYHFDCENRGIGVARERTKIRTVGGKVNSMNTYNDRENIMCYQKKIRRS